MTQQSAKSQKQKTYDRGVWAENIAKFYLIFKGYRILENRYKSPVGEIDLIVRKNKMLIFVEVKSRQTERQALESITPKMRQRIQRAALHYTAQKNLNDTQMRFDVVSVIPPFGIHHLDNAW